MGPTNSVKSRLLLWLFQLLARIRAATIIVIGVARKNKGDLDGAIQDYTEAIRLNPDNDPAYNNRGVARKNKVDLDGAIQDFTEAIRLKPDDVDAKLNLQRLLKKLDKKS